MNNNSPGGGEEAGETNEKLHAFLRSICIQKRVKRPKPKKTWREPWLKSTGSDSIGKPGPITLSTEASKIWVNVLADILEI